MGAIRRRDFLGLALASLAVLAAVGDAQAQAQWPSRPVHLVIPFPPGGGADTVARAVASRLGEILGQSVVVENRTGGNAVVAAGAVLSAPRDGYTFLWDGANQLTNPFLLRDLPFDYKASFIPITLLARFPQVVAVRENFPAATFDEFIAYVKARPGTVSCGTPPSAGMVTSLRAAAAARRHQADPHALPRRPRCGTRDPGRPHRLRDHDHLDHPRAAARRQGAHPRGHQREPARAVPRPADDRRARHAGVRHGRLQRSLRARGYAAGGGSHGCRRRWPRRCAIRRAWRE